MSASEIRPKNFVINIGGLALIYLLLTGLAIGLARSFLSEMIKDGAISQTGSFMAFFSIPIILLVFFVILAARIIKDILAGRAGSRFQIKLLAYFVILIALAASPMIIITYISIGEFMRFWSTLKVSAAMEGAQRFALDTYTLNMEKLESFAEKGYFVRNNEMPEEIIAVQDFLFNGEFWKPHRFSGTETLRLPLPPALHEGIVYRELPRDTNVVRYVTMIEPLTLRVVSWNLGDDFDAALEIIIAEQENFRIIDSIRFDITRLLIFYYGLFFIPTIIMTLIIAISFTHQVSSPITELSRAFQRVTEGDFSIRLLPRKGDELVQLVRSFNSMVEDLERTQESLLKAGKISVWQELAQQLAHEIKNPLTPIRLSAERVLRRWQNEPERIGEILENSMMAIVQETEGISTLLTAFRTLSKPSEPSGSKTDLRELVAEITANYMASHPEINFAIEHTQSGLFLKIDKIKLYQVLSNLCINSIDAMGASGSIEIRSDIVKKKESGYCRISIKDSGCGISKENLQRIFQPYFTTKSSGTGLGLPIVERIVSDHGGTMWVNSAEGAGTTVFIDLPAENDFRE